MHIESQQRHENHKNVLTNVTGQEVPLLTSLLYIQTAVVLRFLIDNKAIAYEFVCRIRKHLNQDLHAVTSQHPLHKAAQILMCVHLLNYWC